MDDRMCTRCHGDIKKEKADSKLADVTRFDSQHPEFRPLKKTANLKFSHYHHLRPGMTERSDDKQSFKLSDIPDADQRKRYARDGDKPDALVQLNCESCHQLDSLTALPSRSSGGYMLPIVYENQCRACHPLYSTPGVVQHHESSEEIDRALQREFSQQSLFGNPGLLHQAYPPDMPDHRPPESETIKAGIDRNVSIAEAKLRQEYCGKCHEFDVAGLKPKRPAQFARIRLEHATFDHRMHRAIACRECHERAYDDSPQASRSAADDLVPNRNVCMKCHGPPAEENGTLKGGARFDCVECHRYHNSSMPLAGRGSQAENPAQKMSIKEFEAGALEAK
jgi:hypothetical protein